MQKTIFFWLTAAISSPLQADELLDIYGKLDISRDHVEGEGNDWVSNVSRLGIKGDASLSETYTLLFQLEQEVDVVSGGLARDTLFSMRNSFVGIEGNFGTVLIGTHDSPFKTAQGDVDVFNDHLADISVLFVGEVRARDSVVYKSPRLGEGVMIGALFTPADEHFGNSHSLSLAYDTGEVAWALGFDSDMRKNDRSTTSTRVYDSLRASVEFTAFSWQLGLMGQASRDDTNPPATDWEPGFVVSATRPFASVAIDVQYANSDIVVEDGAQLAFGVSYFLRSDFRIFGIASALRRAGEDRRLFSIGTEFKF